MRNEERATLSRVVIALVIWIAGTELRLCVLIHDGILVLEADRANNLKHYPNFYC